jgi:hypothetical protein
VNTNEPSRVTQDALGQSSEASSKLLKTLLEGQDGLDRRDGRDGKTSATVIPSHPAYPAHPAHPALLERTQSNPAATTYWRVMLNGALVKPEPFTTPLSAVMSLLGSAVYVNGLIPGWRTVKRTSGEEVDTNPEITPLP